MARSKPVLTEAGAMEARAAVCLPEDDGWWFEPKWDGFRCLAFRQADVVILQAKSGKPLTRYFPEVVAQLAAIPEASFAIDGELLIVQGHQFSFEALQMRLHPAQSRGLGRLPCASRRTTAEPDARNRRPRHRPGLARRRQA
jgi:ATP-dependent DNA ligase